jgi:hypothetical protein
MSETPGTGACQVSGISWNGPLPGTGTGAGICKIQ